jgi:hypothetical protein
MAGSHAIMSVYVDQLFDARAYQYKDRMAARVGARNRHLWCHMWADAPEELHAMADRIGLKREWCQTPEKFLHYDLTPARRAVAVRFGAIEMSLREFREKQWRRPGEPNCVL